LEIKTSSMQVKVGGSSEAGTARVVFATMGVVDHDGDLTERGAFGRQTAKLIPAHDWKSPSIGVVEIHESGSQAVGDIRFNLSMSAAQEWYQALKFNAENDILQEYSYGYEVLASEPRFIEGKRVRVLKKLRVFEVSPVLVGAGVGTHTVDIKSAGSMTMEAHADSVLGAIGGFLDRCEGLKALRARDGRGLSSVARENLSRLIHRVDELKTRMSRLGREDANQLYAEFLALQERLARPPQSGVEVEAQRILQRMFES
jgi:hypothetical protein